MTSSTNVSFPDDQRGVGLTDKPADGYDTGTLADDLIALMDALGHQRFADAEAIFFGYEFAIQGGAMADDVVAYYVSLVADAMQPLAGDVQSAVIAGAGHWVAEQAPDEMVAALRDLMAPYRDESASTADVRSRATAGLRS